MKSDLISCGQGLSVTNTIKAITTKLIIIISIETYYKLRPFGVRARNIHVLLGKINWLPGKKLIENQRKCTVASCLRKLTYW